MELKEKATSLAGAIATVVIAVEAGEFLILLYSMLATSSGLALTKAEFYVIVLTGIIFSSLTTTLIAFFYYTKNAGTRRQILFLLLFGVFLVFLHFLFSIIALHQFDSEILNDFFAGKQPSFLSTGIALLVMNLIVFRRIQRQKT